MRDRPAALARNYARTLCGNRLHHGAIYLVDLEGAHHRFVTQWQTPPELEKYFDEMTLLYRSKPDLASQSLDEPLVLSRDIPEEIWSNTRIFQEWVKPHGAFVSLQTIVLRKPKTIGVFAANRHETLGLATDREIAILRLLAPHIRRAVTISDLMDLKALETDALSATLDNFTPGIVIVGEDNRILHANEAARDTFAVGTPVRSVRGRLSVRDPAAGSELSRVIALAQDDEAAIGAAGIGVALNHPASEPVVAYVLPLARGEIRTRLIPQAIAAVFVAQAAGSPAIDVSAIAVSFGLTPRERRLIEELAAGASLAQAARALAIAETTAKTHLGNIFAKTGVERQADLIALIHRLAPPLGRAGAEDRGRSPLTAS